MSFIANQSALERPCADPCESNSHTSATGIARGAIVTADVSPHDPPYASYAKALLRARRKIRDFFSPSFFADPAFEILLDLFVSAEEGKKVSITSCCIAAAVPTSTALRWIGALVDQGALVREPNALDGRGMWVSLSPASHVAMKGWIQACVSAGGLPALQTRASGPA